jgi:DNA-binding MarR family transcriptional regulator
MGRARGETTDENPGIFHHHQPGRFYEGPNGELDWSIVDEEFKAFAIGQLWHIRKSNTVSNVVGDPFDHRSGRLWIGGIDHLAGDAIGKPLQAGSLRSTATTVMPRSASLTAVARPSSPAAPTTIATRPAGILSFVMGRPRLCESSGQMVVRTVGCRRRVRRQRSNECLAKQVILEGMTTVDPLSPTEEALWRAVMRIVRVVPRHLESDLIRGAGLTASEYTTIMHLSEAPKRELRMADLANATGLSASRTTRLVDDLQSRGLVTKTASSSDARGNVARLTPRGMAKLRSAWPVHLASVRSRFFDSIDAAAVEGVAKALAEVAVRLEDTSAEP